MPPSTVFLLATGTERVAAGVDILAALEIGTAWSLVVRLISVLVTVSISTTISISTTVGIPATILVVPLIVAAISTYAALQASVDVLDFSAAALKVAELGGLPSTTGIFAAGIQRRSTCIDAPARLLVRT